MKNLPIKRKDYDYSVLLVDFLAKLKKYNHDKNDMYDFKFKPLLKGYEIKYHSFNDELKISIKRNIFNGMIVKMYKNGALKIMQIYSSHSPQDNEFIIKKIIQ